MARASNGRAMRAAAETGTDPIRWTIGLTALFAALAWVRLTIPTAPYFDEIHYLPAARHLLEGDKWMNREHPMVGKEMLALGIALFGDNPLGWRIMPLVAGTLALFASMRALWFASLSRFATLAYGILLVSGFLLFIHARIAMLDMFMVSFFALAMWHCAAAVRQPETGRWRLALAGVALGLALGAKWNVLFVAALPGLGFFFARLAAGRRRLLTSRRGAPVPGVSLLEAALWLGLVPVLVYALTYLPAVFIGKDPMPWNGLIAEHVKMLSMQELIVRPHPYMSRWPQWVLDSRSIWYLWEWADRAQRGVVTIGNPLTMLLGLPALVWCAWAGVWQRRWDALAAFLLYAGALGLWIVANKPIQFYYHYFLASCALLAALALALDALWQRGRRSWALAPLVLSVVVFVWFYPILSAAPLEGPRSFEKWMLLDSWR